LGFFNENKYVQAASESVSNFMEEDVLDGKNVLLCNVCAHMKVVSLVVEESVADCVVKMLSIILALSPQPCLKRF
jgi:hypothetical protein